MPVGIQVLGASGAVQIDADYQNLVLRSKIVGVTTSNAGFGLSQGGFTVSARTPIIAWSAGTNSATLTSLVSLSTDSWSGVMLVEGPIGTAFTIYVFDGASQVAASSFGLQVFNAAGTLVFDSGQKYMKIAHVQEGVWPSSGVSWPGGIAGRTYATAYTTMPWHYEHTDGPDGFPADLAENAFTSQHGTDVWLASGPTMWPLAPNDSIPPAFTPGGFLILDVTDY